TLLRRAYDTSEPDVAGCCIDHLRVARRRAISMAVVRCAQERSALEDLARDPNARLARVITVLDRRPAGIVGHAAGLLSIRLLVPVAVPIARPFPHVAGHFMQAVAIRRKGLHGSGPLEAVAPQVLPRKFALPAIGEMFATGREVIAPRILRTL